MTRTASRSRHLEAPSCLLRGKIKIRVCCKIRQLLWIRSEHDVISVFVSCLDPGVRFSLLEMNRRIFCSSNSHWDGIEMKHAMSGTIFHNCDFLLSVLLLKKKDLLPVKTIIIKILTKICIFCVFPLTDYSEMESSHHKECCCLYLLDEGTYSVYKMKDLLKRSACHWIINKIHIDFYYLQLQAAFKTIGKTNQIFPNRFMSYWELLTISYGRVNISLLK